MSPHPTGPLLVCLQRSFDPTTHCITRIGSVQGWKRRPTAVSGTGIGQATTKYIGQVELPNESERWMPTAVIMVSGYDPGYLTIFEHLVRSEITANNAVVVLDVTSLIPTPVDTYHRGVLRLFGFNYPGHDIEARMTALGAVYIRADFFSQHRGSFPLDTRHEDLLEIAVQSALITFFRTDRPDQSKRFVRRITRELLEEGRAVYRVCRALCKKYPNISVAYLPNGRFPHQKMATLAFNDQGIHEMHIEKGEGPNRAYVQDYAPQDRLRSQNSVDAVLAGSSSQRVDEIARSWLAKRAPADDSRNEFSALWSDALPAAIAEHKRDNAKIAGFFTSSQDEFQFLGPEWQLHEWTDQFAAFDLIMTRLEEAGYVCYLRVHPNLATKAHECFLREREGIRQLAKQHPKLIVIWHDDPANTYALLEASDAVVVWDSTVGLEASARGLPVWTTATSRYGLVADVRELLSAADVDIVGVDTWRVDPHRANRFIAYLVLRDQDIVTPDTPWTTWDTSHPPLGVRLAGVVASGALPSPTASVRSLLDVYRHRRPRANIRALSRR